MVQYSMRQNDDKKLVFPTSFRTRCYSSGGDNDNDGGNDDDRGAVVTDDNDDDDALTPEEQKYRDTIIVPLLLKRAYHLPDHTYTQDYIQYICNNHPIFGIWLHHKYHPIRRNIRIISLVGSILFGLAITNIIYLTFVFSNTNYDTAYIEVNVVVDNENGSNNNNNSNNAFVENTVPALSFTNGNIALWTIGAFVHASFDNLIWSLAACSCCIRTTIRDGGSDELHQRYRNTGVVFVILFVIIATALATFAVTLRAAMTSSNDTEIQPQVVDPDTVQSYGFNDDNIQLFRIDNATNDFEFIIAYFIELVLNYLIYYPIVSIILFSGMLTFGGRYNCGGGGGGGTVFGGRPYEMKLAAETNDPIVAKNYIGRVVNHTTIQLQTTTTDMEQPKDKP